MKKKVLFALIALFSFLSSWAQTTTVALDNEANGYKAVLGQAVPYVFKGAGLPTVTSITNEGEAVPGTISPALADKGNYKVVQLVGTDMVPVGKANGTGDDALSVGNYYLEFQVVGTNTMKLVWVPFQVIRVGVQRTPTNNNVSADYEVILDEGTFNASVGGDNGLHLYYQDRPWCDLGKVSSGLVTSVYDPTGEAWFDGKTNAERLAWWNTVSTNPDDNGATNGDVLFAGLLEQGYERSWATCLAAPKGAEGLPWIVVSGIQEEAVKPKFLYDGVVAQTPDHLTDGNAGFPWGAGVFGTADGSKSWGVASSYYEIGTSADITDWKISNVGDETAFDPAKFQILLYPADDIEVVAPRNVERTDIADASVTFGNYVYNGAEQKPVFKAVPATDTTPAVAANAFVIYGEGADAVTLVEGQDFTVAFPGSDYTNASQNAADKQVVITGIGAYKGEKNVNYSIAQFPLSADNFALDTDNTTASFVFNNDNQEPGVVGSAVLIAGAQPTDLGEGDFTAVLKKEVNNADDETVQHAKNVGTYYYEITPGGNFTKAVENNEAVSIILPFSITTLSLSDAGVVTMPIVIVGQEEVPGYVYNTKVQKPVFTTTTTPAVTADATVTYAKSETETVTLVEGTDFTVAFPGDDYTNVDEKTYTITFTGNYEGTINGTYAIVAKDIDKIDQKKFNDPTFSPSAGGAVIEAKNFEFKYNGTDLVLATEAEGDFTWAWDYSSLEDPTDEDAQAEYRTTAGNKSLTVTGQVNYTGTTTVNFYLKPFAVTITPATVSKVYGEPDPLPNFSIDANSATQIEYGGDDWKYIQSFLVMERNVNDDNNSDELRETVVEGGHKYAIKIVDPNAECNYEIIIQNNDGILMIYPAPLNVHVANNSKTYGDPDPNFTADKKNGNVVVDAFKISKRNEDGTDGDDLTSFKDFVDETKNLKDVLNISRVAGEEVKYADGQPTPYYDFTWNNPNYDVTFVPEKFKITPKQIQIDLALNDNGYEYKGAEWKPVPTVTIKGTETQLVNDKDFVVTWTVGSEAMGNDLINVTQGDNSNANNRWPKATVSQAAEGNYTFVSADKYFKIIKAELNIIAITDSKKAYGEADPNPLAKLSFAAGKGPKGRDTYNNENGEFNFTFSAPLIIRVAGEHTGNYKMSINPNATTRNYNIVSTATANFLIYRTDQIVIYFDPAEKTITYGDAIDLKTLVKVDAPTGVDATDLLTYAKNNVKKYDAEDEDKEYVDDNNVGTYKLTIDDYPTAFKNYDVVLQEGTLIIEHFPLFIIANDKKEYGDPEPTTYAWDVYEKQYTSATAFKYVKTDKVQAADVPEADLIGNTGDWMQDLYRYTISRERGENVGHYDTTIRNDRGIPFSWNREYYGTQTDGNYSFTFAQGDFEITRRALNVTVTGASKKYGEFDPQYDSNGPTLSDDLYEAPEVEEEEGEEGEEAEEPAPAIAIFQKGHVIITVTNALPRDVRNIADKVTYKYSDPRVAGETVKDGGYDVKDVKFDGLAAGHVSLTNRLDNYTLNFVDDANFMIEKRLLKVTAHDQSVPYAQPLVIEPYDLTITEGILKDNVYVTGDPKGVKYFDDVTFWGPESKPVIDDEVDEVFKPLAVAEGKTAVGTFHKDAFILELTEFGAQNYELEFTNGKLYIEQASVLYLDMKDLAQALTDHIGRTVEVRLCGAPVKEEGCDPFRQFRAYQWNTLVLPFTAMPREISAAFRYAFIDIIDEANENPANLSLAQTAKRIPANYPFIFQTDKNWRYDGAAGSKPTDITFGQREIADFDYLNADPTAEDAAGNKFIGTYKPKSDFDASNYIMRENSGEFFRFVAGADGVAPSYAMRQTEAYLEAANGALGAPTRIIIDNEDGTTTAIEFVGADAIVTSNAAEGWYTINGIKLEGEPTTSGTYIFNGKKVFIQK